MEVKDHRRFFRNPGFPLYCVLHDPVKPFFCRHRVIDLETSPAAKVTNASSGRTKPGFKVFFIVPIFIRKCLVESLNFFSKY
ncbi:hypothetical protein ASE55_09460 [Chryseobacterium sp. Leaf201]|nr:hypothetical protein ASE55_09460 [Chryseobacterium sp. Leaf201]